MGPFAAVAAGSSWPQGAALALLIPALPFCFWVALSDLKHMKIRNLAVLGLLVVFCAVAPFVLPWPVWGWQLVQAACILIVGFLLNMAGALGAGDAKFLAVAAAFVPAADATAAMLLLATVLLAALATHRAIRHLSAVRAAAPDWESWTSAKFPMGFALGPALALYLALAAVG